MGDGGVACASLQHLMERYPATEALCVANGMVSFKNDKQMRQADEQQERGRRGDEKAWNKDTEKDEAAVERYRKDDLPRGDSEIQRDDAQLSQKDDLEKGEIVPDRHMKEELEKGEFVPPDRHRREDLEKGEFLTEKHHKEELHKGGLFLEKSRKKEPEKESGMEKSKKADLERGEFVPDKWRKSDRERSPENHRRKDGGRNESDHRKRGSSKWEGSLHERDIKNSSRSAEEPGQLKHERCNGKIYGKDHNAGLLQKRHTSDSENGSRKHPGEFRDHSGSKSRRVSENGNKSSYSEISGRSLSSSASRAASISRTSSTKNHEPSSATRGNDSKIRSPGHCERSPHDRSRHYEHMDRISTERSPYDRSKYHDHRERNSSRSNRSPYERARQHDRREHNHKSGGSEKHQSNRFEEKSSWRESNGKDAQKVSTVKQCDGCIDKVSNVKPNDAKGLQKSSLEPGELPPPPPPLPPPPPPPPLNHANGFIEDQAMMEEDMDICDTPPHNFLANLNMGKWFYLDHFGTEQGPSKLVDLKRLVDEGVLLSDHLIKRADSDRWVTVENATSPAVPSDFHFDSSEMVNPPEAPGNALSDFDDLCVPFGKGLQPKDTSVPLKVVQDFMIDETVNYVKGLQPEDASVSLEVVQDLMIDERVESLLSDYNIVCGKELETLGEALCTTFTYAEWENWSRSEGFTRSRHGAFDLNLYYRDEDIRPYTEANLKESSESKVSTAFEEFTIPDVDSDSWFAARWSCKGGDWKRNDEAAQDGPYKKKLVLNEGYPLCQMSRSGCPDPRFQIKDDLYYSGHSKTLELPLWAFTWAEDKNESINDPSVSIAGGRSGHTRSLVSRALKGTMLPVIRINACVIKDQGSSRLRGNERHTSRTSRSYTFGDHRESFSDSSHSRKPLDIDFRSIPECKAILTAPRDHVCTIDELSVHLGGWYYLDGIGHEHGPLSYSELQDLVAQAALLKDCSVFRKDDNTWLPIMSNSIPLASTTCIPFHGLHPQYIGYVRGKLHELVMKSYKNREFASAINEVLDPWLSEKQPKKVVDKHFPFNFSITRSSAVLAHDLSGDRFWKSDESIAGLDRDVMRSGKRFRKSLDGTEFEIGTDVDEDCPAIQTDCAFEDLCSQAASLADKFSNTSDGDESWGLLNGRILARVFHCLRTDMKSLVFSAVTCKHWKEAVNFYKSVAKCVDFSSFGPKCTDSMFRSVMSGSYLKNVSSLVLLGCSSISESALEEVLDSFPLISSVDIRGCNQFMDLISKIQFVTWMHNYGPRKIEEQSKLRSLKSIAEKCHSVSKAAKGSANFLEDYKEIYQTSSMDQNFSSQPFRQGYYKRTKLLDARKSSAVLSRDARMKQLLRKKSEIAYKKMKDYISISLRDIMKGNTIEFFITRVTEIEERIRNGYYSRRGLDYIKDDIRRVCRDALKTRSRGEVGEMNQIVMLLNQLVKSLDGKLKSSNEREDTIGIMKDDSGDDFYSSSRNGKKQNRAMYDRGALRKSIDTLHANGGSSKLGKRDVNLAGDTSDEHDISCGDGKFDVESTDSDTESDLDLHSRRKRDIKGDMYGLLDDVLDSVNDDREWGARMTRAGLVPPVTRKYEVIDTYFIVADEEEVRRKMKVALPDDYAERLLAQRSTTEETDMELPVVKENKPRKVLGDEVLEQEVYGIDPYTHNLILDSMPDESDWPLVEKHKFIEEVLLRVLNKKTRHFTGTGNTPIIYPLIPVIEDILRTAEDEDNTRVLEMCQFLLKTMQSRPEDNYVAYRKGLGVVCNKVEGFKEDEFIVEFLGEVYPAWKWFEKEDGIRSMQKNSQEPAPEFYNIYLERPKGDRDGYDLVVVDAMHKANYASRICHSCRPNCEAKVTAVDGLYQIRLYTMRPISYGEEITFDYNSVTESKEEHEASVCLCGSQGCRGSYLNLSGEGAFQKVLKDRHGILHRHKLLLEACEANFVSQEDYNDLGRAGLGTCLLSGLPDWLVAYIAHLVRFINLERTKLPEEILKHNVEEKRKFFSDICMEMEKSDAEIQAEGVYNSRLQTIALMLDKVRYVMRRVFGEPRLAPPPFKKLDPDSLVSVLWNGEYSLVEELLHCMAPHMEAAVLNDLKIKIQAHDPSVSEDPRRELKTCLLWLRDELRSLPCTYKCRHDAAADLVHMYAYTKCFFKVQDYRTVQSPPVYISPLDLGPKYAEKMGSGFQEYCKTYEGNYCMDQLINWYIQSNVDKDSSILARARRGCLSLPDISSFYGKSQKPLHEHVYGSRTLRFMLSRMERQPERPWPKDRIWVFKNNPKIFGSPMMDAILNDCPLDKEMMHWLKTRRNVFQGAWDG